MLYSGSVEIHRDASDWAGHRHHEAARYNCVILHVALFARRTARPATTNSGRPVPVLLLGRHLDAIPQVRRAAWLGRIPPGTDRALPCSGVNELIAPGLLQEWLTRLGTERLEKKSLRWGRRLSALLDEACDPVGARTGAIADRPPSRYARGDFVSPFFWDQVLYEALMEGLGYAKNRQAFRILAQTAPLASLRRIGLENTPNVLAVLFGASRLLPDPAVLEDPLAQRYAADLRDRWRILSYAFPSSPLHASDWQFFRLRPSNFPTSRIAAFAYALPVIFRAGFRGYLDILHSGQSVDHAARRLRSTLTVRARGFWRYRAGFDEPAVGGGSAIGRARATELIINAILPLGLQFADTFGDAGLRTAVRTMLTEWSIAPAHRILAQMRADLFRGRVAANSPLLYQGAIELYGEYCSRLRCRECLVGAACGFVRSSAVSSWRPERGCC